MSAEPKTYLIGDSIGSLAAAAFIGCDVGMPGENINPRKASRFGGSLDGVDNANAFVGGFGLWDGKSPGQTNRASVAGRPPNGKRLQRTRREPKANR